MHILKCFVILCSIIVAAYSENITTDVEITESNINPVIDSTAVSASNITIHVKDLSNVSASNATIHYKDSTAVSASDITIHDKDSSNVSASNPTIHYKNSTTVSARNVTKHYVLVGNRKPILIINSIALRSRSKVKSSSSKSKDVESLLYEEYDDQGTKLNEFFMYNLADVAHFFENYLHAEVCHVRCDKS